MRAIVAVNNLAYIGLNGGLPWKCKADLRHFKAMTEHYNLLVGYNTFQSLPPLKNRTVTVDTPDFTDEFVENTFDWIIGGAKTYNKYRHLITELHVSIINDNTIGDTLLPKMLGFNGKCLIFTYYFEPDI